MKTKSPGNRPNPQPSTKNPQPRYALRKHISFWALDFEGQRAVFDHEQGAYYVAYLLLNPPDEPIHGLELELKATSFFGELPDEPCETLIVDPATTETVAVGSNAVVMERNFGLDEVQSAIYLRRQIEKLEVILEDPTASSPVKDEVIRELQEIYQFRSEKPLNLVSTAQKVVRSVRMAINRFHQHLETAFNGKGQPHAVLRPFAAHIQRYLLIPTARYSRPGTLITREGPSGSFTYEPPPEVKWTA